MLEKTRQMETTRAADRPPLTTRRVDAIPVALPLKAPMKMAGVTITTAENLLVRIEAAEGTIGWGEAPSAPMMTGDTQGGLVAAVRDHLGPLLLGRNAFDRTALVTAMRRALMGNSGAHSAVEMALRDLAGRASGTRLIELVAKPARRKVAPMWLLGNATVEEDIAEAHIRAAEGYHLFKLKIGVKPLAVEIAAAHAMRAAFPNTPPCAAANCGLTLAAARRYADKVCDAGLAFIEQPLAYDDLAGLKTLTRATVVPIWIDEGIHSLADIEASKRAGATGG